MHDRSLAAIRVGALDVHFECAAGVGRLRVGDRACAAGGALDTSGGAELVASADARYVALHGFSGQSTQGYEVFALEPEPHSLGGLPDTRGHGDPPSFSPGGQWIASWTDGPREVRESGLHIEEALGLADSSMATIDWSVLHLQRLPGATVTSHLVGVLAPLSTDMEEVYDWRTYDGLRFIDDSRLELRMPWGERLLVPLPVEAPIVATALVP